MPSKTISYVGYQGRTVSMTVEQISQNAAQNTSTVRWTLETSGGDSAYYYTGIKAYVAGEKVYEKEQSYTVHSFPSGRGTVSGEVTIAHNSLGEGTVSFSLSAFVYSSTYHNYSDTLALTTIPRVSQLILSTYDLYAGQAITADTVRYDTSLIDEVLLTFGSHSIYLSGGEPFTIPLSWLDAIPDTMSGTAEVKIITYNGQTPIGSSSVSITVRVPASAAPSVNSLTIEDMTILPNAFRGKVMQNLSRLGVTASGSARYGAEISSVSITAENVDYQGTGRIVLNPPKESGTEVLRVKVTDSRGMVSSEYTQNITVYPYAPPEITNATVSTSGSTATLHIEGSISSVNNTNTKRLTIQYKRAQSSSWTTAATLTSIGYTFSTNRTITGLDEMETYQFRAVLEDAATDAGMISPYTWNSSTGRLCLSFYAGGTGAAFFKEAERDGLDINGDLYISGKLNGEDVSHIETGSATMTYIADVLTTVSIQFSRTYSSPPAVMVSQIFNGSNIVVLNEDITTSGFTAKHIAATGTPTGSRDFKWIAIGR